MKFLIKMTSDEPGFKEVKQAKSIPLPKGLITKQVQKTAFDLIKTQIQDDIVSKAGGNVEINVEVDKDTEYKFSFKQGEWTRTVYSAIV